LAAFAAQAAVTLNAQAGWRRVYIKASRPGLGAGGETVSITRDGWLFFPPVNETLSYDLDGNLTADARWTYGWDGDNRLIWMEEKPIAGTGPRPSRQRLEYTYDSQSRRIAKRVLRKTHESADWSLHQHRQFLYDGWNMIGELDVPTTGGTARLHRSYAWGLDASGTRTGAGGVGGLLLTTHYATPGSGTSSNVTLAPLYDLNANVLAYAEVTTSTITHRIDYDPFGNELTLDTLLPTAAAEEAPRFRFSTKYTDSESGLVYYGFRSYSPELGRWVNRDPIEERGGVNLYGMVGNNAVNRWDVLGLMVTATYDISRQRFEATSDTGGKLSCRKNGCSCGDNNENNTDEPNVGPLPKGVYKIYKRVKNGESDFNGLGTAWILDAQDANPGDDTTANGRFGFRIHLWVEALPQKGSDGCIVLSEDCHSRFEQMVERTTPGPLKRINSPNDSGGVEWFDEVAELGTLTVK
jgi:RHS repeat-associated protein